MQPVQVRMGRGCAGAGCLLVAVPLLAIIGVLVILGQVSSAIADVITPGSAPGVLRLVIVVVVAWVLLRLLTRPLRRRMQPPPGMSPADIFGHGPFGPDGVQRPGSGPQRRGPGGVIDVDASDIDPNDE
ncbi:MAG: hypothetical protein O3A28_03035 [Actinomycetota bacterium]|nr:hypothetical protein [Actinomycetota bacterium]MDA3006601.1 hypothetical protein [Actinomycetota bacterium]MDA3033989.1 hypothetical protein [Actinomycetota bacterium]